jgi:hypothetical protein
MCSPYNMNPHKLLFDSWARREVCWFCLLNREKREKKF